MKELTGQEPKKLLAANGVNVNLSDDEADDISKQATAEIGKLSQDKRDEIAADGLKQARDASKAMQTYKDKKEELEKQLDNAKESKDEGAIEKAQAALDDFKKNAEGPAASLEAVTQKASETNKSNGGDEDTSKEPGEDGEPEGTTAKEEEVTDKDTGKKVKRKVYTGPKGGRYYYPNGVPHTPEHKVYVESLTEFLRRTLAD
jgi:colicin import membrane protein